MYPTILSASLGEELAFFGLKIPCMSYASSVFPVVLSVIAFSYVYKLIDRFTPANVKIVFCGFLSMLVSMPFILAWIAPLGSHLTSGIAGGIDAFFRFCPWLAGAVYCGSKPLQTVFGVKGWGAFILANLAENSYDYLLAHAFISNIAICDACFVLALSAKEAKEKSTAISTGSLCILDYKTILKEGCCDFISFSYYFTTVSKDDPNNHPGSFRKETKNPYIKQSDWGWGLDPTGLRISMNEMYDRYHKPMLIAENGLGAFDKLENGKVHDEYRIDYLRTHIKALQETISDGVEVMGYTMWGCIDLVACSTCEMDKRYGFIYVDAQNDGTGSYKRYRKDSFYWYKKVIASNGADLD